MNKFKRTIFSVLASLLIIGNVNANDKIKIATEGAYPPWNSKNEAGKLIGFEVELAWSLCRYIGRQCEIVEQDWDGMIPALQLRKYDAIIAGMSITDERKKVITFSQGYADEVASLAVMKGSDLEGMETPAGINLTKPDSTAKKAGKPVVLVGPTFSGGAFGNGVGVGLRQAAQMGENTTLGKRDAELLRAFNKAIDQARKDGVISRLAIKWFGFDASM